MSSPSNGQLGLRPTRDRTRPHLIAESLRSRDETQAELKEFLRWFDERAALNLANVQHVPFNELRQWAVHPGTGDIAHDTGRFFTVHGVEVRSPDGPVPLWTQPIIHQPEVGILGILVKEFDGVLHCLMQAKNEPGNCDGVQLSPTVQATKSNYSRVHRGSPVPYVEYFREADPADVVCDSLQSEQGSWFFGKRNRNMVVETRDDVEVREGFRWLTLGQVYRLLAADNLVNMDARSVLACLPFAGGRPGVPPVEAESNFAGAVLASCDERRGSRHTTSELLSWLTDVRTRKEMSVRRIPLNALTDWSTSKNSVSHDTGRFFRVIAVRVELNREVRTWTQPMIEPSESGVIAFLVKRFQGCLHVLAHARMEPGFVNVELAPTVQYTPGVLEVLPAQARPVFHREVTSARESQIRFDTTLSEEGGRFYDARNRYLLIEADEETARTEPPDFRWIALHQFVDLLRHSHYVNVQARSLIACLFSLAGDQGS